MKFLYHANCTDGSGAALAAWMKHGNEGHDYIPVQYGSAPPAGLDGEQVYILDFSYPCATVIDLAKRCKRVTVIDHHKTAQADLSAPFPDHDEGHELCPVEVIFDMHESGAVLAYRYFFGFDPPALLLHIQDRDLWRFELRGTREIISGLRLIPDWREWNYYISCPDDLAELVCQGEAVNTFLDMEADRIVKTPPRHWEVTGDTVPVYNLPGFMISDTLHKALECYPDAPYAVGWFELSDRRVYSLRSRNGSDVDVSAIAKSHGGGGHKHAAGYTVVWGSDEDNHHT